MGLLCNSLTLQKRRRVYGFWQRCRPLKKRSHCWLTSLLLFVLIVLAQPGGWLGGNSASAIAAKPETILSFDSKIVVNEDSSLVVTEKIKVNAEGQSIKRGIYRDFPLTSPFHDYLVPFEVISTERNGKSIGLKRAATIFASICTKTTFIWTPASTNTHSPIKQTNS